MPVNPFETSGQQVLMDWFDTVVDSLPGIYVVAGVSGTTVWTTKRRCLEGLKVRGRQCVAVRGADQRLVAEAAAHAKSGTIVLLALKVSHPEKAKARLDELGLGSGWELVRGVLFQQLEEVAGRIEVQTSYTAVSHA